MDFSHPITAVIPSLDGEVLSALARTTRHLTGRQVAKVTSSGSASGVRLVLLRLEEQGIAITETAGTATLYRANREHILWNALEALVTSADTAQHDLETRIVDTLASALTPQVFSRATVALFGSVARGDSTSISDIDLVAVFPDELDAEQAREAIDLLTGRVFQWTGNRCNVYVASDRLLKSLTANDDAMIASWNIDARTLHGMDLRDRILAAR